MAMFSQLDVTSFVALLSIFLSALGVAQLGAWPRARDHAVKVREKGLKKFKGRKVTLNVLVEAYEVLQRHQRVSGRVARAGMVTMLSSLLIVVSSAIGLLLHLLMLYNDVVNDALLTIIFASIFFFIMFFWTLIYYARAS